MEYTVFISYHVLLVLCENKQNCLILLSVTTWLINTVHHYLTQYSMVIFIPMNWGTRHGVGKIRTLLRELQSSVTRK